MSESRLRALTKEDCELVARFTEVNWSSRMVVAKDRRLYTENLEGFLAESRDGPVGLASYEVKGPGCEIVTVNSFLLGRGIGQSLLIL